MPIRIIRKATSRPVTLADVIDRLKQRSDIDKQRRHLISAVTCAAKLLDRQPCEVSTDVPQLRERLLSIHPVSARMTAKRLANLKSDLSRALAITGAMPRPLPRVEPSEGWRAFLDRADIHQSKALSRMSRYCTLQEAEPCDNSDELLAGLHDHLHMTLLTKDPTKLCKEMAQTWNAIVRRNAPDLPLLTVPRAAVYQTAPLSDYPNSLQEDIERYLDRLAHPDLFEEDGLDKPLRPTSLRNIRAHIRQLLNAAVSSGYKREDLKTLADLVDIELLDAAFKSITARIGRDTPPTIHNITATILAIARHHVKAPAATVARIEKAKRNIAHRLGTGRPQMTEKNMDRLAQFDDPANIILLVNLPDRLMKRAGQNANSSRSAVEAMHAVAIAILLGCPMRAANLAGLDIGRDLKVLKKGTQRRYYLRVEGNRVKNGTPIDIDLDVHVSRLLSRYLDHHRQHLSADAGTALFPRRSGGPRRPDDLGHSLPKLIRRKTGLVMNPHLFRHLAGMLFLQRHPGEFETVRRLLGHKRQETTMAFYARFDAMWAARRYDEVVLSQYRRAS